VLLPLVLIGGGAAMVLLGTVFHAAGKAFGARNWEGSVSIYLYAASAALVPLVVSLVASFLVAGIGYLVAIPWPATREVTAPFARWTGLILCPAGLLAGLALLVVDAAAGCTRAFGLDPMLGAAAGVSGILLSAVVVGGTLWSFSQWGMGVGLVTMAVVACVVAVAAAGCKAADRRNEGSG
jgi:hypothetical protein